VAVDGEGHVVVLAQGGVAITDPLVGPTGVQNIPTVPVGADGVGVDTSTLAPGTVFLTMTWREVEEVTAGLLVLKQAPWFRLVLPADIVDDGLQLLLAEVSLDAGGAVNSLAVGARRAVVVQTGGVRWHRPDADPATASTVDQHPSGGLAPRPDGGLDVAVATPSGTSGPDLVALSVLGGSGNVQLGAGLAVQADATVDGSLSVAGNAAVAGTTSLNADVECLSGLRVDGAVQLASSLAVAGALTAASATTSSATTGSLTVSGNATVGAGGDGVLLSRHVKGKHFTSDAFDGLFLNWDTGFAVHVGGAKPADLNVTRNLFVGGRVGVHTNAPAFDVHVNGTVCAVTFCNPSDLRLKEDVVEAVDVLDRLAGVRAVTFSRAEASDVAPADAPTRHAGVVAQDVVGAFPELVVPMGSDGLMAVDYAGLTGVLVGAVNELRAVVESLTDRVAELEHRGARDVDVERG
jgi:hypothetical protein